VFNGGIRDFFAGFIGARGCCGGGCCGGMTPPPRERDYDPAPRYDRGLAAAPRQAPMGCYASIPYSCTGCSGMMYAGGSCFGSSCFGSSGMMSVPMPSLGNGYALPIEASYGMNLPNCDCGSMPVAFGESPAIPRLGRPLFENPNIMNPNVPRDGFSQPFEAQPSMTESRSSLRGPESEKQRGTITIRLPAEAKLFVEGQQQKVTNGTRTFVTPPLPADREAIYNVKIEIVRDGETMTLTKKAYVRAGGSTVVEFTDYAASKSAPKGDTAAKSPLPKLPDMLVTLPELSAPRPGGSTGEIPTVKPPVSDNAKFTVKLPEGAVLYVNGAKNDRSEALRLFATPTLAPGKSYQYVMKAELTRNGLPEYQEQKIDFQAGDNLTLDFTSLGVAESRTARK